MDIEAIKQEYLRGELDYIHAIEKLQEEAGLNSLDAEKTVSDWDDEELLKT